MSCSFATFWTKHPTIRFGAHLLVFFCLLSTITATAAPLPREITRALADASVPADATSFLVVNAQTGASLLSHNATKPMNPASVMKIITTAAALELLGPQFKWRTEFLSASEPENGALKTPLFIRASGDPKITWEDLDSIVRRLRARGIQSLPAGIVIDKRVFSITEQDPAQFDRAPLRPYNVAPDAMLFNFKAVEFKIQFANASVTVEPHPNPSGLNVSNQLKLTNEPCGDWKSKARASFSTEATTARATFSGTFSAQCGERQWFVSLLDHDPFFEGSVRWAWARAGGGALGAVQMGPVDVNAKLIDAHESQPLPWAVNDVNKFSNNVMAQHLLLTIDKEKNGSPATLTRGSETVKRWMNETVKVTQGLVVENGSGLSRSERVSAQTLVALFRHMQGRPTFETYLNSLPIAGVDGTLGARFAQSNAKANSFLKTGGLNDVRSLAGYLRKSDGDWLYFVGIINHSNAAAGMRALERAVEWSFTQ